MRRWRRCAEGVDIALSFAGVEPRDEHLDSRLLLEDEMLLALGREHPLARAPRVRLEKLRCEHWIVGTASEGPGLIATACLRAGFEPRVAARLDHQPAIQAAVAAGIGVTLIPELAARHAHPGIVVRRLPPPPVTRQVFAHWIADAQDPAVEAGLTALVRAATGQLDTAS